MPSWLRKNALCLSQSAFSNFAPYVRKVIKNRKQLCFYEYSYLVTRFWRYSHLLYSSVRNGVTPWLLDGNKSGTGMIKGLTDGLDGLLTDKEKLVHWSIDWLVDLLITSFLLSDRVDAIMFRKLIFFKLYFSSAASGCVLDACIGNGVHRLAEISPRSRAALAPSIEDGPVNDTGALQRNGHDNRRQDYSRWIWWGMLLRSTTLP